MAIGIRDILTVDYLKNTLLVGVSLLDDAGQPYPDDLFSNAIEQAISLIEEELQIVIDPHSTRGERHDAISQNRRSWWGATLDRRPLKSVDKLTISYGNYPETDIPLEWTNITSEVGGSVHLIPTAATLGTFSFNNSIPLLVDPISNFSYHERVPAYFKFDYTSGFNFIEGTITIPQGSTEVLDIAIAETLVDKPNFLFTITDDGNGNAQGAATPKIKTFNVGDDKFSVESNLTPAVSDMIISYKLYTCPNLLLKCISYVAALLPLDTAGDLIAGAGIGSFSIGVDGLSQTVNTTSSATSAGYGAKMISYRSQLKEAVKILKGKYRLSKIAMF